MQEWTRECEKKVKKQKSQEYFYECCVKIWSDLNYRLTVAWDNKIVKYEKYRCEVQEWICECEKKKNK